MSSDEFVEWIAFWAIEAEEQDVTTERRPTQEELTSKIYAWAAQHNAAWEARQGKRG